MPRFTGPLILLAIAALASCDGSPSTPDGRPGPAATLEVTSGNAQGDTVLSTLGEPLVVRVLDARGQPVPDATVSWTAEGGSGAVAPASSVSDASGLARTTWTLGKTAGSLSVTASGAGEPVRFTATARPGKPVAYALVGDTVRRIAVGDTARVVIRGTDSHGNFDDQAGRGLEWKSLHAADASVDATGLVRGLQWGTTRVTTATPSGAVAVRFAVSSADVRVSPMGIVRDPGGAQWYQRAGRSLLQLQFTRTSSSYVLFEHENGAWKQVVANGTGLSWLLSRLYVSSSGTAYAVQGLNTIQSTPAGGPRELEIAGGRDGATAGVDGVGDTVFVFGPGKVFRVAGDGLVATSIPAPFGPIDPRSTVASGGRFYAALDSLVTWNGTAWVGVPEAGGGATIRPSQLVSRAGHDALALVGKDAVYALRGGRAHRFVLPEAARGSEIEGLGVGPDGSPALMLPGRALWFEGGRWREFRVPAGWSASRGFWADESGGAWLYVTRPAPESISAAYESAVLEVEGAGL